MDIGLASTFPPYRGGISAFNEQLVQAFEAAGHGVRGVNWSRQYPRLLFPGSSQIQPHSHLSDSSFPTLLDSINPRSWRRTGEALTAEGRLDVLVLPFWHAFVAPALAGVARAARPNTHRMVGLMHNAGSHDGPAFAEKLTARFVHRLDEAWTLSEEVADRLQSIRPSLSTKVLFHPLYDHFPPLPSRAEARNKLGIPPNAKCLLFFGLIRPYKGLKGLLEVWPKLAQDRPDVHLIVAGECYGDWTPYEALIEASGYGNRVHRHLHFVPDAEVGVFFGAADCVTLPYERASQSGVTAMALHYGVPTVCSDVGGLSEYVLPGQTGELAPAGSSEDLRAAILRCLEESYPLEGFEEMRQRYSWARFTEAALNP